MHLVLLIAAYQPDNTLFDIIKNSTDIVNNNSELNNSKFSIVVVNDASTKEISHQTFALIKSKLPSVIILNRKYNGGQGASLKTGFSWILENLKNVDFVVTADADGQHLPQDIISIFNEGINTNFEFPILGVRHFGKNVPARSRIGNIVTSYIVRYLYGCDVKDTQTGLRGFPISYLNALILKKSNRFNFNSEVLVHLMMNNHFIQKTITTVYEPGNPSSHFRPIIDSLQIYSIFFKYALVMLSVFLIEFLNFSILNYYLKDSLTSFASAKFISIIISFLLLKEKVFLSKSYNWRSIIWYFSLSIFHLFSVWWIFEIFQKYTIISELFSALISYLIMFFVVYWVQRKFIFRTTKKI